MTTLQKLVKKQTEKMETMELSSSQSDLLDEVLKLERQIMGEQLINQFNQ